MAWPLGPLMPSQSPVPVGFKPDASPNWGTSEASIARLNGNAVVDEVDRASAAAMIAVDVNFIFDQDLRWLFVIFI